MNSVINKINIEIFNKIYEYIYIYIYIYDTQTKSGII